MASTEGGTEIEEVAEATPEKILKEWVDPITGLTDYQARNLAFGLGLSGPSVRKAVRFMRGLYQAFVEKDCSLAEINPLIVTGDGDILALDAKINLTVPSTYTRIWQSCETSMRKTQKRSKPASMT